MQVNFTLEYEIRPSCFLMILQYSESLHETIKNNEVEIIDYINNGNYDFFDYIFTEMDYYDSIVFDKLVMYLAQTNVPLLKKWYKENADEEEYQNLIFMILTNYSLDVLENFFQTKEDFKFFVNEIKLDVLKKEIQNIIDYLAKN